MKQFTLARYKEALKKSGPIAREFILQRACEDKGISLLDLAALEDIAEQMAERSQTV